MKLFRNDRNEIAKFISLGAFLTSITVIFQSAPVYLPMIGLILSPISTLPVALAAAYSIYLGTFVYVSSAILLFFIYVQESIIFLLTTGLIGLATGSFLFRKGMILSILFSTILLSTGMVFLTFVLDIEVIGNFTSSIAFPFLFIFFPILYVTIWNVCIKKIARYFLRGKNYY